MRTRLFVPGILLLSAVSFLCVASAYSQSSSETGRLKIHVDPKQAYVFVDGKAIRDGSQTIDLAAGKHSVGVYNYVNVFTSYRLFVCSELESRVNPLCVNRLTWSPVETSLSDAFHNDACQRPST